ncbi:PucR family transcriptional regulator [Knoellia subterranea]|uniref:Transcriptional regulator n=1 Tax=Knoellia subterranea KCTC 19937 TaxID=1385521 RepID=A0A0A0JK24_9MICO|nr:helix-turn-helix domain-containing protein [Knoellia subterranea]KGN36407.1 transcriptional regulator [Knoellia subterranea KCTC 19937]
MVNVANDLGRKDQQLPADGPGVVEDGSTVASLRRVVDHQAELLRREDEVNRILVQTVLAGGSLADLCRALVELFPGVALVTTTDGRIVATAGSEADVAQAMALECFDRTGRLIVEDEPVGVRTPGATKSERTMVRIVAGTSDHGLLAVFTPGRVLTTTDVHGLERASAVAALAITKEQAVSAVEGKYRAEFLRDTLVGRAGAPEEAIAHAASLGWNLDRRMVVVVAETDEDDSRTSRDAEELRSLQERFVRAWVQAVRTREPNAPVAGFSQEVVALLPAPCAPGTGEPGTTGTTGTADTSDANGERGSVMRSVGEIVKVVRGDGGGGRRTFSTGVSRPVESVADIPRAYAEALRAVAVGRQMQGESAVMHFDGLGIYRLLSLIPDSADLRAFVDEALCELATDDQPSYADLRQTLQVLLDTNLNVAETARILFFHYNTLRYRITKLEQMLGPFTTDPQLRLTLALALRIRQMRGV